MKKILFVLALFISCFIIYELTDDDRIYYMSIGDGLSKGICGEQSCYGYSLMISDYLDNRESLYRYNNYFCDNDLRITDIIQMIEYNESIYDLNNNKIYINEALNEADLLTISIGNNELYYKLLMNNVGVYSYIMEMLDDIVVLFGKISKYDFKDVLVTGYYNVGTNSGDVIKYLNYHMKLLCDEYGFTFVDISILSNNFSYFDDINYYYPNSDGYKKIFELMVDKLENS